MKTYEFSIRKYSSIGMIRIGMDEEMFQMLGCLGDAQDQQERARQVLNELCIDPETIIHQREFTYPEDSE